MFGRLGIVVVGISLLWTAANVAAESALQVREGTPLVVWGTSKKDKLNLRSDASASAAVLAELPPDTAGLTATGRTRMNGPDQWIEIRHKKKIGWVHSRFVRPASKGADPVLKSPPKEVAQVEPSADPLADCNSDEDTRRLAGCSALIAQGDLPSVSLAMAYSRRSDAHLAAQDFDKAITDRSAASTHEPNDADLKKRLIHAYGLRAADRRAIGDLDGAIADYTEAVRLDPQHHEFLAARSVVNLQKADYEGAIADLETASRLDAANATYRSALARILEERGVAHLQAKDFDRAIADFTKAMELEPSRESLFLHRGAAREQNGQLALALSDYFQAKRINPENAATYVRLGALSSATGQHSSAIDYLAEAIKRDPSNVTAHLMRGLAFEEARQPEQAVAEYQAVLKIDRKHKLAKTSLARVSPHSPTSPEKQKSPVKQVSSSQYECCLRYKRRQGITSPQGACRNHVWMQRNNPAQAGVSDWCAL